MEIKLNAGDRINIPENCQARIEDNQIIIEEKKDEQKDEFKDGDILISKSTNNIVIFKNHSKCKPEKFESYWNDYTDDNDEWACVSFRHATEEERQKFFDKLKANGLRWNTETKELEKIRKRVSYEDTYLHINQFLEVVETEECLTPHDDYNYNSGNYYLLEERGQAEEDAKAVRAIFEKRLKVKL